MKFSMHYDLRKGHFVSYIFREYPGYRECLSGGTWSRVNKGEILPVFLEVEEGEANELFKSILNELKDKGFCTDRTDLNSTERHLEDMRAITFHKLGMKK